MQNEELAETLRTGINVNLKIQRNKLRQTQRQIRVATLKFKYQIEQHGKSTCRPFCEAMHAALPRELRDMIYEGFIEEHNATFYHSGDGTTLYANGRSALQHCFDPAYTGYGMHQDMIEGLGRKDSRFDFRGRHKMVGETFFQYTHHFGFDLTSIIRSIGVMVNSANMKEREDMFLYLKALFNLRKGTVVTIFIESGGSNKIQVTRSFRQILRVIFPFLNELRDAEYKLNIVLNPGYVPSAVKNGSGTAFSIVPTQKFRYLFTPDNAKFTPEGFEEKLQEYFSMYKGGWYQRIVPDKPELSEDSDSW
ncbi:hypothetical protein P153DRAFT_379961 [Dothidotthia symphoricarpi CBS 119687]|uniref:Uncharacterized protein n=1 Tax=Dothidotthia symphoricarpi CBS 119687 TaxID=1392245 RepID=A0A6A5ZX00_9PLEO|nr:uncharacterized protein P153DRAFT_379961 [Dothidotthia symphoricarpi CBS 119687]KAF2124059.1 hypothetical protein P153DRAFT_379961 [Dothidotthia symphoricarpi CBS 119687]